MKQLILFGLITIFYITNIAQIDGSFEHSKIVYADVDFTPQAYTVSRNYPNPFNPVINVKYNLPYESEVRIVILNSLGQEITELVNGIQNKGFYEITWKANDFASGVYFYNIKALSTNRQFSFHETKKLILVK